MTTEIGKLQQATIVDQDGSKIGSVGQVYVDDRTSRPTFATVKTGLFGSKETFVPLAKARETADGLAVPYTKDFVKDAPNLDADEHLSEQQQHEIYRYYQLDGSSGSNDDAVGNAGAGGAAGAAGAAAGNSANSGKTDAAADPTSARLPTSGGAPEGGAPETGSRTTGTQPTGTQATGTQATDGPDESVTLREERLNVGKERVDAGRVRIRKYVVTDQETVTVPVEREEYEVVREPIADGERGGSLGEDSAEVHLSEERPVVDKEVVDAERVGLKTHTVTDQQQVRAEVGHEEFEVDEAGSDIPDKKKPQ